MGKNVCLKASTYPENSWVSKKVPAYTTQSSMCSESIFHVEASSDEEDGEDKASTDATDTTTDEDTTADTANRRRLVDEKTTITGERIYNVDFNDNEEPLMLNLTKLVKITNKDACTFKCNIRSENCLKTYVKNADLD